MADEQPQKPIQTTDPDKLAHEGIVAGIVAGLSGEPSTERDEWMAKYLREQEQRVANAKADLKKKMVELGKLGLHHVKVHYDGSGDSGEIEEVAFAKADGTEFVPEDGVEDAISDIVYGMLPGGWEINEGSYGDVTISVEGEVVKVKHEHNERIEKVETTEEEETL
jgi:hypothetical protein